MDETLKIKFIGDASDLEKASARATQSVSRVSQSIETLRGKLEARKSFLIGETDIAKIAVYNKEISGLKNQIDKIQKIGIGDLGANKLVSGANSAFGALRKLAYTLPGIGVAGLIAQFSDLAVELVNGGFSIDAIGQKLGLVAKKTVDVKAVLGGFGDIFTEASKKVAEDAVKLEVYKQKLNDVNIPASERLKILKEYNSIADSTNKIDATQINNLDLINQKIDAQNTLILKRALSTATMGKISEEANKLIEKELKLQEELSRRGFKDLDDYNAKQKESIAERGKLFKADPNAFKQADNLNQVRKGLDGVVNPAIKAADAFRDDESAFKGLISTVAKGRGDLQKLIGNLSGLITVPGLTTEKVQDKKTKQDKTEFLFDFLPFDPSGKLKPEQRATVLSAMDKFSKEFTGIFKGVDFTRQAKSEDEKIKIGLQFDADLKAGKVEFDVKSFQDAINKSLRPEDVLPPDSLKELSTIVVDQFVKGFQDESERIKSQNPFNLPLNFNISTDIDAQMDLFKTKLKQIGEQIPKSIEAIDTNGIKRKFNLNDLFDVTKVSQGDAVKAIQDAFQQIKSTLDKQMDEINSSVGNFFSDVFTGVGDNIVTALQKGIDPIKAVASSIFSALGGLIQNIGKALVKYGVVKTGLDKILKGGIAIPGVAAIAIGASAIALGALIKSLGAVKGFAKGGMVPGQGNGDTVPAMLTPGEYVVPKIQVPKFLLWLKEQGKSVSIPKISNGIVTAATGGFVPSNRNSNFATGPQMVEVPYFIGLDISHDKFRLLAQRANKYGNTFGR